MWGLLLVAACAQAQNQPWQAALQQRHDALVEQNGPGTDAALRGLLLTLRAQDQKARFENSQAVEKEQVADAHELVALDRRLTAKLKAIVAKSGWPTIKLVGIDASNGAMLILTHSPDHAWQRELLPKLEALARAGQIDGSPLAVVVDKELVALGKPQRYGTQFKFVDGKAMMFAVEDPATLERRRAEVLLPPMDVYRQALGEMYHVEVSDVILRPDEAK
jgi:hypothetical protein